MTYEEAREAVLSLLRKQGRAKNSEMQAALVDMARKGTRVKRTMSTVVLRQTTAPVQVVDRRGTTPGRE